MKAGQLVKNVNSGRIVTIKNIDQVGINYKKIDSHGYKYEMLTGSFRSLTFFETLDYKLNYFWESWKKA